MLVILQSNSDRAEVSELKNFLSKQNLIVDQSLESEGVLYLKNVPVGFEETRILTFSCVSKVINVKPDFQKVRSVGAPVIDGTIIGKDNLMVIAGPCAVDDISNFEKTVVGIISLGIKYLRLGIFKPRTSPYSFKGTAKKDLHILANIKNKYQIKYVAEILDPREIDSVYDLVDIVQIGSRNMQNYTLLEEVGKLDKPVLLKRGFNATIEEFMLATEYILNEGNQRVILCERGIRTFENSTRNTLDISSIPIIKEMTSLPLIVDPSHASGNKKLVEPLCLASVSAGADGLMIEVHADPKDSLCDAHESLSVTDFKNLFEKLSKLSRFFSKELILERKNTFDRVRE